MRLVLSKGTSYGRGSTAIGLCSFDQLCLPFQAIMATPAVVKRQWMPHLGSNNNNNNNDFITSSPYSQGTKSYATSLASSQGTSSVIREEDVQVKVKCTEPQCNGTATPLVKKTFKKRRRRKSEYDVSYDVGILCF